MPELKLENIPAELRKLQQWVLWKYEERNGKRTKPPYQANGANPPTRAAVDNPTTWSTYPQAAGLVQAEGSLWPGIGFVFTASDPFCGIDLDDCLDEAGHLADWATVIVAELDSYTEVSPSGQGLHVIVQAAVNGGGRNGQIEIYDRGRYFCGTGNRWPGTPATIEERQEPLAALWERVKAPAGEPAGASTPQPPDSSPVDLSDAELLDKARNAANGARFRALYDDGDFAAYGKEKQSAADLALCNLLAFWTNADFARMDSLFRQSKLYRGKWDEVHSSDGQTYGEMTLHAAIAGCKKSYQPAGPSLADANQSTEGEEPGAGARSVESEPKPPAESACAKSLAAVLGLFQEWLHLPHTGAVEAILGAIAANYGPGDPVWLLVIGPPGGGKSESLNALTSLPDVYPVAVLTEAALLSGTPKKERESGSRGGLLRQVGDFGILLVKDFGGVLSLNRDSRGPILAALREVYDGSWTRYVGTGGGRELHWQGKCGLVGGATPAIDRHYAVMSSLGERFAFFRMEEEERIVKGVKSLVFRGQEVEMRKALAGAVKDLFAGLTMPQQPLPLTEEEITILVNLADFTTVCRSPIDRNPYGDHEIELIPEPEVPTRFVKMLALLWDGMTAIGIERSRGLNLVRHVAISSMPRIRQKILLHTIGNPDTLTTSGIATEVGYPTNTTRMVLEDLTCLNVFHRESGGKGKADVWTVTDWTESTFDKAGLNLTRNSGGGIY